ncbi:MAG TPA: M48 family metalloprotease [Gemmatimonadaceae bacterium]|nr:M48 family metalloprotease [Gemmatimonadaceae bacterium]
MFAAGAGLVAYIRKHGAEKVLWSSGAWQLLEPATPAQKTLDNVVQEMAIASGLPKPTLWIIDDPDPNAFATGNDPAHSHIAVTTGLLDAVSRDELQAVIGHEMGHVKNLDMQLMTMVAGLVGAVALISDGLGRVLRGGVRMGGGRGGGRVGGGGGGGKRGGAGPLVLIILAIWLVSWILAPIITRLMAMGISRRREYLADAMSAQFTRNPAALATALEKIERASAPTTSIKSGVAHLCIADPLGRRVSSVEGFVGDFLATHPPMALRVARLKAMGYQAQKAAGTFEAT